jgi:hypothetical protein
MYNKKVKDFVETSGSRHLSGSVLGKQENVTRSPVRDNNFMTLKGTDGNTEILTQKPPPPPTYLRGLIVLHKPCNLVRPTVTYSNGRANKVTKLFCTFYEILYDELPDAFNVKNSIQAGPSVCAV